MIQYKTDVNEQSSGSRRLKTVQVLLEHGADITAQDDTQSTPLHLASSEGLVDIMQILLEHGADVNARNLSHRTPLDLAFRASDKLRDS